MERTIIPDEEMIMHIVFISPFGSTAKPEQLSQYPPIKEQIESARAEGRKAIMVFEHNDYDQREVV